MWYIFSTRFPNAPLTGYHLSYLFDIEGTEDSDYKFKVDNYKCIEKIIQDCCNRYENMIKPSIDGDKSHYYPEGDLLKAIKKMDLKGYSDWMRHIANE